MIRHMKTCKVECVVKVGGRIILEKSWPAVDIMKTSVTRSWATRQFNKAVASAPVGDIVAVSWDCYHGAPSHNHFSGRVVGVHGSVYRKGMFE